MEKKYYLLKLWPIYLLAAVIFIAATFSTSKAVTTFAESTPIPRNHTVVIDAGHGGEDGGATSCNGVLESQLNLEIALKLNDLLHLLGYQTTMIRTTDISVYTEGKTLAAKKASDLRNRVKLANETENAVLISIHQNIFSDSQYSGAQVFYAPTNRSEELAVAMQTALVAACNPGSNRKAKAANGIYLMQHIQCPGILIECGFLSNPAEEAKLRGKVYQNQLCCTISAILGNYLAAK